MRFPLRHVVRTLPSDGNSTADRQSIPACRKNFCQLMLSSLTLLVITNSAFAAEEKKPSLVFEKDVRPIFKASCFHCHGESGQSEGGLDLRLVRLMAKGGESGAAIVAGKREESSIYQRVRDGEMPPDKAHQLTPQQVETIGKWIDAGAPTLRPEPEAIQGMLITEEELSHWSFQKIARPPVPQVKGAALVKSPIDAFLLAKLEEKGFSFSEEAQRSTLLRRLRLDLIGLPPSPEDLKAFESDQRPDAWEKLVEELLASSHYGERWGRHWLDVVGYSDSDGYITQDLQRKHAWRYRDYVIKSFNADKPFDRFILEQLAGDELVTSPLNNLTPEDAELLVATGFLRMAPDGTSGRVEDVNLARNDVVTETMKIVSSSLIGLTVGCAQCHDHRYDPIPTADYYRIRAVFDPAFNTKQWRNPQQRLVSLYTEADRQKAAEIEKQAKEVEQQRLQKQTELIDAAFAKELAKLPEDIRVKADGIQKIAVKDRNDEQKALIKKYPALNISPGSLYLYDNKGANELKKMADDAAAIRATKPREEFVHALTEVKGQVPKSFVFYRGDHEQPKDEVTPAGLTAISMLTKLPEIPVGDPKAPTTGRRSAFAKHLTDPNHPLTARVLVNRIWMHHFGRGLVSTPADFGILGSPPTHPELLDWLASEFIESGWSVKHIHRLIVNSTAYRQKVRSSPEQDQADPDNLLYGGARLIRLDAETLRDSILTVSGQLNKEMYGPPVTVIADSSGRWVLGIENLIVGRPGPILPLNGKENVRSVYVEARRSRPLAVLDTFDWPTMAPNCDIRHSSTVTPQALMLMNSDFVMDYSAKLARKIESIAGNDLEKQIALAWELSYCRKPNPSEMTTAVAFMEEQTALLKERLPQTPPEKGKPAPLTPQQRSLDCLCQMLLSSNEFLYIE